MQFCTAPTQSHQKLKKGQSLKALKAALSNRGPFNMVFSTFQLGRIHQHHWKERLQISKIAKFESDTSQASEVIAQQSCENL